MKKEKNGSKTRITFVTVRPLLRIFVSAFSLTALAVNAAAVTSGGHSVPIMVLSLVFLLAGLYENSWEFDLTQKQAVQRHGLIFLSKKRIIRFAAIHTITIETFGLPIKKGSYTQIGMYLTDGEKIVIEKDKTRNLQSQIDGLATVQSIIKADAEQAASDFFDSVAAEISDGTPST